MIPRFKPALGAKELLSVLRPSQADEVTQFERQFAALMGQKHAVAFAYGRSGLILLLHALGLKNKEIICPAYTCVVVAHAIVYSGNVPVFIDCAYGEFNMDLDLAEKSISKNTGAIIATSLFGYPVNLDQIQYLRKAYPHIYIIQDCAHSFCAEWKSKPVQHEGDAALFGLNISKMMTSIFGGMVTTNNDAVCNQLRQLRSEFLKSANWGKCLRRVVYLIMAFNAFNPVSYAMISRLENSGLLNYFAKYYHEDKIDMPWDYCDQMSVVEAKVGKENIKRLPEILLKRKAAAEYYFENLADCKGIVLPPKVDGATYSHFTMMVKDKNRWLNRGLKKGIQIGWIIDYSIPELKAYGACPPHKFPLSAKYSRSCINLPVWGGIPIAKKVITALFP
jgi:dTDP-4-amino-4,6-dideoxygalactose transaminase